MNREPIARLSLHRRLPTNSYEMEVIHSSDDFGVAFIPAGPRRDYFASLFAAAPDLLAIAEEVAEHFAGTDAPLGIAARAAISKAKGEAP